MSYKIIFLFIDISIALAIFLAARQRSKAQGADSLQIFSISLIVWSLSSLLYENLAGVASNKLWISILLLSMLFAASAQLTFSLSYTNRPDWITRSVIIILGVMPLATLAMLWINPINAIFLKYQGVLEFTNISGSIWGKIMAFYIYNLIGASVLLLLEIYSRKPRSPSFRTWIILAGSMAPLIIQMLISIGFNQLPHNEISIFAFTLAGLGFSYGILNQNLLDAVPMTREEIVEGMDEGWIVLNMQNVVVDANPAAELIIGMSREKAYGQPLTSILSDLSGLGQALSSDQELEMKRSLKSDQGWRYMNIRTSTIKGLNNQHSSRLIVWRDNTKRKLAEEARQRARDELFVLLNAISSAASQATDLDDFLSESIYQIVYPFRSQFIGIFLVDERNKNEDKRLFLASQLGIPVEAVDKMSYISMSTPLVESILKDGQAILIAHPESDSRVPLKMQKFGLSCLLVIPLVTQTGEDSKFLGLISLARKEGAAFTQDEVVRMTMISDHIANLIDSDRRRKLAIALSERQKLLRDLHDSVSQKLYGLVTLTEAAQAGLEAGSSVDPSPLLKKIGESARQAVKEMRLFLYQLQPIEVEKDGLVSVLHHRLASVEGRADIKARLLADEDISLTTQQEVALYFIAQEALNNILRHAQAKSIEIKLLQGPRNVNLEIVDDGHGFDPKKVEPGGMGLRNMKERTLQINGKFKLVSNPDQGTRINVSVPRDQSTKSYKQKRRRRKS
jgi:PAS domain S-box-containing protein